MSLSEDENFFISMEALAHVYLQAFAKMQSPCKQIELESEALDSLWIIMEAGKDRISSDAGFNFLSKDQMLEHGLDSAFKERLDMATFAHGAMVSQPDLARIQQSLRDFELVFLQRPKDMEDEDEPEPLIETFLYLITLTLALAVKKAKTNPTVANVQRICNTKTIPAIGALKDGNLKPLIKLAANLVSDNVLFSAMHNDTLKIITTIIRHRLHGLGPPRDAESYLVVSRDYQENVDDIYVGEEAQKLLSQEDVGPRKWFQDDVLKASYIRSDRPNEEVEDDEEVIKEEKNDRKKNRKESRKENSTVADKEDHENDHEDNQEDHTNDEERTPVSEGKEKQKVTTSAANVEDNSDVDDASEVTATPVSKEKTRTQKSKEPTTTNTKKKKASNEQPEELGSPSRSTRSRIAKLTYQLVPQRFGSEEFEGGDELPPPPLSKKRRIVSDDAEAYATDPEDENSSESMDTEDNGETLQHKAKKTTNKTCDPCGDCDGSGRKHGKPGRPRKVSVPESDAETNSSSAPNRPKERKKNRPWTSEEVSRLESLVNMPQFKHSLEKQRHKIRKLTIRWAALKMYDQDNGNVLRHRTQVQLKDKHRDLSDDGEHYRQVKEINKRRQEPQMRFPADSSRRL
ncbi:hypothetical protein BG006_006424 [Podila minutissima]|uniref:Uncharacterized protein n=1 Tax=Podila minutissima TaxID=64525 RepID=A0A9P5VLF9_9FUNG|nr:hypothetical protein BG006_006424 [Podila minutissima]